MKYLQIFEAFESSSLNRTLSFLNKDSKSKFKDLIKTIGNSFDLPYSLISDDYIEYLPYKKALSKFKEPNKKIPDCKATSIEMFKSYGIEGETCKNGKIKRSWGDGIRITDCPNCKGTGKLTLDKELLLIKFWFNSEGEYITSTGVDGTISAPIDTDFSRDLKDYKIGAEIGFREANNLPEGTPVLFLKDDPSRRDVPVLAVVHRGISDRRERETLYFLQNSFGGSTPSGDWRRLYGFKHSWEITSDGNIHKLNLLIPIKDEDKIEKKSKEISPFDFNFNLNLGLNKEMKCLLNIKESDLKDAHFALILDIEKLKELKTKSLSKIRVDRKSSKEGAYALLKNEDIKKLNLQRYLSMLSDPSGNMADSKRIILRLLGGSKCLFLFRVSDSMQYLNDLPSLYGRLLKSVNPDGTIISQKDYDAAEADLKNRVKRYIGNTNDIKERVTKRVNTFKEENSGLTKSVELIEKVEDLSNYIYQGIERQNIENIDDIEVIYLKIKSIISMLSNSRFLTNKIWEYTIRYSVNNNEFNTVMTNREYTGDIDEVINYIDTRFKPMISKILN